MPTSDDSNNDFVMVERPFPQVALVRLNRPEVRNALNLATRIQLSLRFRELTEDDAVHCIVITGDDRAFCGGADLREYLNATTVDIAQRNLRQLWSAISGCPKPIIAAVNGYALGGGCELAMQADIIVAGESARFGQPEVRVGLMPGAGATQRLTRAVGKARAMKLLLTGEMISAAEALSFGLVSTVVPDQETLDCSMELAKRIAASPTLAVRQIKELVIESMNSTLESGVRLEAKAFQILFSSEDKTEGIRAFLEKRSPVYRGR